MGSKTRNIIQFIILFFLHASCVNQATSWSRCCVEFWAIILSYQLLDSFQWSSLPVVLNDIIRILKQWKRWMAVMKLKFSTSFQKLTFKQFISSMISICNPHTFFFKLSKLRDLHLICSDSHMKMLDRHFKRCAKRLHSRCHNGCLNSDGLIWTAHVHCLEQSSTKERSGARTDIHFLDNNKAHLQLRQITLQNSSECAQLNLDCMCIQHWLLSICISRKNTMNRK